MTTNNTSEQNMPHSHDHSADEVHAHDHAPARDMSSLYLPGAIIIAGVLVAGGLFLGLSHSAPAAATGAQQPAAAVVDIKNVKTAGEPYLGQDNAPVVLAFWSDFQCPFCKAFETGGVTGINTPAALPAIITQYVNTGKVKVVFKDFAFLGNDSISAGEYGRSIWALYPSQYFAWRTAMYKAQDQEGDKGFGNAATIDALIKSQLPQISDASVKADVAKNKAAYDTAMQADMQEAQSLGIQGTPGFVTGTKLISGAEPLAAFTSVIDPQLK